MLKLFQYSTLILCFALCLNAQGIEPDWPTKQAVINAQEQSLRDFLQSFFSTNGIKVLLSEKVGGRISGRFSDRPEKVFSDLVKAYSLLPYYDGHAMHISLASEAQSRSIKIDKRKISKIIIEISRQELVNDYQSVQVLPQQSLIKVRGARQFIYDTQELVNALVGRPRTSSAANRNVVIKSSGKRNELVFKTFPLKYASAADVSYFQNGAEVVIPGVATLLSNMVGDGRSLSSRTQRFGPPGSRALQGLRGKGLSRFNNTDDDSQVTGRVNKSEPLRANTTGRGSVVRIEPERNLNAVIVRDYADSMPLYANLIEQLDKEPQLVEIQVTIIDIDKNKLKDLGFDWLYDGNRNQARLGGGEGLDAFAENGGLLLNTVIGDARQLLARVRALAKRGSAKVVSRPQVLTLSNIEAVLQNDQSFYVRVAGREEVDLFNVSAGTTLRVLPNIVGERSSPKIRLLVTIEDGVIVPDASVDDIPIIEQSSLSTQAIIFDGENLLLGGLVRDSKTETVSKVPILGDMPGIGKLFQRNNTLENRTERLFLISPRIVTDNRTAMKTL